MSCHHHEVPARTAAGPPSPRTPATWVSFAGQPIGLGDSLLTHWFREHAFPGADYMQKRFGVCSRYLLPYYYAKRIVRGAGGWLRRL